MVEASVETRLGFALAVSTLGSSALVIDEQNRAAGWRCITDAVTDGVSFAIRPRPDLLAVDADGPERGDAAERLARELSERGYKPVLVASGTPGSRHLWCQVPATADRESWIARCKGLDLDVRGRARIRPPLTPHRSGLAVSILMPTDLHEALEALRATWESEPHPEPLSSRMERLLVEGQDPVRYRRPGRGLVDRSAVHQALVTAMLNASWPEDSMLDALMDKTNRGGAKLREVHRQRGTASANRYLHRSLEAARELPSAGFTQRSREDALADIACSACRNSWRGMNGATDRSVLGAHLRTAVNLGRATYGLSVRQAAELSGASRSAAAASQMRLVEAGWLVQITKGKGSSASRWRLRSPAHTNELPRTVKGPLGGCKTDCPAWFRDPSSDLWRWSGLGKSTERVWLALTDSPRSGSQLSVNLRIGVRAVAQHLARLREFDLAEKHGSGWVRGSTMPDEAAKQITDPKTGESLAGAGERQHRRHLSERDRDTRKHREETVMDVVVFTSAISLPDRGSSAGAFVVVDLATGEVLRRHSAAFGRLGCNQAAAVAGLMALEQARRFGASNVLLRSNSEHFVRQRLGEYRVKDPYLRQVAMKISSIEPRIQGDVSYEWVPASDPSIVDCRALAAARL